MRAIDAPAAGWYPDPENRARFAHEARAAATLDHTAICKVFDFEEYERSAFIAMDFIKVFNGSYPTPSQSLTLYWKQFSTNGTFFSSSTRSIFLHMRRQAHPNVRTMLWTCPNIPTSCMDAGLSPAFVFLRHSSTSSHPTL